LVNGRVLGQLREQIKVKGAFCDRLAIFRFGEELLFLTNLKLGHE
jgi:hypothetical protein